MKKISLVLVVLMLISCLCLPAYATSSSESEVAGNTNRGIGPISTPFYTTQGTVNVNPYGIIVDYTHISYGNVVSVVQRLLKLFNASHYGANCDPGSVDGTFGNMTDAAVRSYQSYKGLTSDGSVGMNTWLSLISYYELDLSSTTLSIPQLP